MPDVFTVFWNKDDDDDDDNELLSNSWSAPRGTLYNGLYGVGGGGGGMGTALKGFHYLKYMKR